MKSVVRHHEDDIKKNTKITDNDTIHNESNCIRVNQNTFETTRKNKINNPTNIYPNKLERQAWKKR